MKKVFFGRSLDFLNSEQSAAHKQNLIQNSADLERAAGNLSSFGGGGGGYIGLGDDFLEFTGKQGSFVDPIDKGKLYTITLTNANASQRIAILCPGLLYTAAVGLMVEGAFNDANGAAGLSGAGSPEALQYFNAFMHNYPTICVGFKVTCSNVIQMDNVITIQKQSPFKIHATRIINPAVYADEANPQTGLISVQESFYMNDQTLISYAVAGSTSVSLGLFFGVSLNISNALREKVTRAKATMSASGIMPGAVSSYRGRR
ncbi:MAG: hypothetical protein ACXVIY_00910 [Mucilaginibacter sp.]